MYQGVPRGAQNSWNVRNFSFLDSKILFNINVSALNKQNVKNKVTRLVLHHLFCIQTFFSHHGNRV